MSQKQGVDEEKLSAPPKFCWLTINIQTELSSLLNSECLGFPRPCTQTHHLSLQALEIPMRSSFKLELCTLSLLAQDTHA